MRRTVALLPQFGTLCHPKPVLLINYHQPEIAILHVFLNQRMSANKNVYSAVKQPLLDPVPLTPLCGAGKQSHLHINAGHEFADRTKMLHCKHFGRGHKAPLVTVVGPDQHAHQRHHRLAAPDIALQEPVHLPPAAKVGTDLADHPFLRTGEGKGKVVCVKRIESLPDD